jgi:hypothetical protein
VVCLIWWLFFSYAIQLEPHFSYIGDDGSYLEAARLFYFEHKLHATRPWLISAWFGIPYLFGLHDFEVICWGLFINFISWFFTIILIFKVIVTFADKQVAFILSLFFMLSIGNLAHSFNFLSESIFIFLIVLSLYFISKYIQTHQHYYITLAVSVLLFNTLIKPVAIGLVVILSLFYVSKRFLIISNRYAVLLFVAVMMLGFQVCTMKKNYGDYTLSYIGSITYHSYLGAKADCYRKNIEYEPGKNQRGDAFEKLNFHEMKLAAHADFKEQLTNNKLNLLKAYLYNIYSNTHKGNFIVSECKNTNKTFYFKYFHFLFKAISKLQNISYTLFAVLISLYSLIYFDKKQNFFNLIAAFILYIFFVSAISNFQCDRFHIIIFPLLFVLTLRFVPKKYIPFKH